VKWLVASAVIALCAFTFLQADAVQVPSAMLVGNQQLPAASCATRDTLWIHHYAAALYVPPREAPVDALEDPKQPKALRVQILSKALLPRDLPKKWRDTLVQQLDGAAYGAVRNAWQELAVGDQVTVAYAPGPGVTLQLNERLVARTPRHELIEALLRTWADGAPVREQVSRAVARHPCQR
jgi:Chalcone isomerase-like